MTTRAFTIHVPLFGGDDPAPAKLASATPTKQPAAMNTQPLATIPPMPTTPTLSDDERKIIALTGIAEADYIAQREGRGLAFARASAEKAADALLTDEEREVARALGHSATDALHAREADARARARSAPCP